MNEEPEGLLKNYLNAEELLASNSLRARVSNEIEQTSKVIPKTGLRLFEPNGSWLQNRQIDACLEARRDLINVERVKKVSKLAVGEWLPQERRVIVTKRSGVDWNNFGCELRGTLYLNPEEALLQVELNCLDLLFNGVSLSVQQAYELLINAPNSDCSLEEYRVYSQLARSGYRLKRFYYQKSDYEKDDSSQLKKKVIIDLEGSQWMSGAPLSRDTADKNTKNDAEFVINSIIDKIEVEEQNSEDKSAENILNKIENDIKSKDKNKRRLNIVSVETMVEPVKLVANKKESNPSLGIRIQRNVKLLPKRTDKIIPSYLNIDSNSGQITSDKFNTSDSEKVAEKRKLDVINTSVPSTSSLSLESLKEVTLIPVKKIKNEKIELSDDEIEEIPIPMTRQEMLNCLPNIKDKNSIKVTIDPKYIPQDIKLNKNTIEYDSSNLNDSRENYQNNRQLNKFSSSRGVHKNWINNINHTNNYRRPSYQDITNYHMMYGNSSNYNYPAFNYSNQQSVSNRWSSLHVNFFKNIAMATFALRTSITQSLSNIYSSSSFDPQQYFGGRQNSRYYNPGIYHNNRSQKSIDNTNNINKNENKNRDLLNPVEDSDFENYCSFEKAPADSWTQLKKLWKDAKTITIEDDNDHVDCSEVEVINHTIQPLVGPKYSSNLKQIYDRLKIIKPAQDKSVRKKRGIYKISYKVYSNTQLYRKASPGHAMFHLVITSQKNSQSLQPIDLNRLYQDGDGIAIVFAHVSGATICFMQAGVVALPNLE